MTLDRLTLEPPVHRPRLLAPAVLLATGLAVAGCTQPESANDNGPQPQPSQPEVQRSPEPVESAPATVPEVPAENQATGSPAAS